jgi:GAF domain-containing protein
MSETPKGDAPKPALRSDPPPEDLKRERDTFIQQFFRRGAQLSEELLGDIERLREQNRELESENARLRAQMASDTAIRDLLRKIEDLETEKRHLMTQARSGSGLAEFADRFAELENELANLGTLHVANVQLHSSTTVRRAFRNLRELLAQFLGAAEFAVYWESDDARLLVPISVEGVTIKEAREFTLEDKAAGRAYQQGEVFADVGIDAHAGSMARPAAVIPMHMQSQRLGAIVIFKTLEQKTRFDGSDFELFKLLSTQAAASIVHAYLFAEAGRKAPAVQAFIDQED